MKGKAIIIICTCIILVVVLITLSYFVLNFNKDNNSNSIINNTTNSIIDNNSTPIQNEEDNNDSTFSLYHTNENLEEVEVGTYLRNSGYHKLCKISFPSNYQIQRGTLMNKNGKENIDGIISSLIENSKINLEDKLLCNFYIGNEGFNSVEPKEGDIFAHVAVYTDAWKEMENMKKDTYKVKVGNYTLYGVESKNGNYDNTILVSIPIDEHLIIDINYSICSKSKQLSVKEVVDAFAENISFDF